MSIAISHDHLAKAGLLPPWTLAALFRGHRPQPHGPGLLRGLVAVGLVIMMCVLLSSLFSDTVESESLCGMGYDSEQLYRLTALERIA